MEHKRLKKGFLVLLCFLLSVSVFGAPQQEEEKAPAAGAVPEGKYNEAPMLTELVKAGKLPPVDERLPEEPMVGVSSVGKDELTPVIGKYGGTLRLVDFKAPPSWGDDLGWTIREYLLEGPGTNYILKYIEPNILEGFEIGPEAKVFTFHMREGLKYSDGTPFTSEDVRFWYEDTELNKDIKPNIDWWWLNSGGKDTEEPLKIKVVDDYTFQFISRIPFPNFLSFVRLMWGTGVGGYLPSTFWKQHHPKYTSMDVINKRLKDEGFEEGEWWRLFKLIDQRHRSKEDGPFDVPTMAPWIIDSITQTRWVLSRNPYYFKVDAAGNQLPYFDYVNLSIVTDSDAAALKIVAGEVDVARVAVTLKNIPLFQQYAKEKDYSIIPLTSHSSPAELLFNLTHEDPVFRQVVTDLRFRRAVSFAINRQKVIDIVFEGLGGPPRTIPIEGYDVDKANQLLDEMGLEKRDSDGFRLGSDGKKFIIPMELYPIVPEALPTAEIVQRELENVGLAVTIKTIEGELWRETGSANKLYSFTNWMGYPEWPFPGEHFIAGDGWGVGTYGIEWFRWWSTRNDPEPAGQEPPEDYKRMRELNNLQRAQTDPNVQGQMWDEMKEIFTRNLWWIPMVDDLVSPMIASNRVGNVPTKGVSFVIASAMEQMFFKD